MTLEAVEQVLASVEARSRALNRERMLAICRRHLEGESGDLAALDRAEAELRIEPAYRAAVEAGQRLPGLEPRAARRLALHARSITETRVRTDPAIADLTRRLNDRILSFKPRLNGHPGAWADIREVLRRSPDRARREAAWFATAPLADALAPDLVHLFELRNSVSAGLGYPGFTDLAFEVGELSRLEYMSLCDELETLTRPGYQEFLDRAREKTGDGPIEPWDIEFILAGMEPDRAAFPGESFPARMEAVLSGWGIDPAALRVTVQSADLPYAGLCLTVSVPDDIRILLNPRDGIIYMETFFHEYGHALHMAHLDPAEEVFHHEAGCFDEAMGILLERVALRSESARRPWSPDLAQWERWRSIFRMRHLVGSSLFEMLAYDRPEGDLDALHAEIQEHYLGVSPHPGPMWASRALFVTHPLYLPNYVLARLIAGHVLAALRERFGDVLDRPEVGSFLVTHLWRPGAAWPWDEKLIRATGRPLDSSAWLREVGVDVSW